MRELERDSQRPRTAPSRRRSPSSAAAASARLDRAGGDRRPGSRLELAGRDDARERCQRAEVGAALRPRRRDRRRLRDDRRRRAAAALRRPHQRRHDRSPPSAPARRARRRDLLPPSAADDPRRRRRPRRRAVRRRRLERGGARARRSASPSASECVPSRSPRKPRRLPRRRLDRLQLPGRARGVAAELLDAVGVEDARELLAPLVLRTAANWAERGAEALTGPIARGDEATVERHLAALARARARAARRCTRRSPSGPRELAAGRTEAPA